MIPPIKKLQHLSRMIGNTPLLAIVFEYKNKRKTIFAKAENLNMTGSIKDRMAFYILWHAYQNSQIKENCPIVEATSGNTGISISAISSALGHPTTIFMPDWMSEERKMIIRCFGTKIVLVSKKQGGFVGSIEMANKLADSMEDAFLPSQFSNEANTNAHYLSTGPEIWAQLQSQYIPFRAFVAGVGTGGTIMGVGKFLNERNSTIRVHPLEPTNSPTLSTGRKVGKHRIQGISDEFIPAIVDLKKLDEVIDIDDGDAIIMCQKLARLGLAVGISSGANFLGALKIQEKMDLNSGVVTVFADSNKKYLSTDLLKQEPVKKSFLSKDVKLLYFKVIGRGPQPYYR